MAQNQQICQACDTAGNPKWKCFTCDVLLCESCNYKIHVKVKKNTNHKVIDLKNVNSESMKTAMKSVNLKDIPCVSHDTQSAIIYCEQCDQLVCALCLVEGHQSHKLQPIELMYTDKLEKLCTTETNINQSLQEIQPLSEQIQQVMSEESKEYKQAREKIQRKEKEMTELMKNESKRLIGELDQLWSPREKELTKFHKDTVAKQRSLQQKETQINEIFLSHNAAKVFEFSDHYIEDTSFQSKNIITKQSLKFSESGQDVKDAIKFGTIVKLPEFIREGSFTSDFDDIYRIKTLKNGVNIMCLLNKQGFNSFNLQDGRCIIGTTVKYIGGYIDDMAVIDNTILFIIRRSFDIKSVANFPENRKIEVYISLPSLYPTAIHVTSTRIFVGFRNNEWNYEGRNGILIYDHKTSHIGTIELDPSIFIGWNRVTCTTNINGDICVVGRTSHSSWESRLIVLGEFGNLKWIYDQPPITSIYMSSRMLMDVLTTPSGLILVTDYCSNAVHVLSMEGQLLTSLNHSHRIERPRILNIDHEGNLQIACIGEQKERGKQKLLVFKFNA